MPQGRCLTLNAIAGIGMLTVGIVGGPLIGKMQEDVVAKKMDANTYALPSPVESSYLLGKYTAVDAARWEHWKRKQQPRSMKKLKFSSKELWPTSPYSLFSCWAAT